MEHSKRISHTTNIKLEPYSIVTDTSTVATDYASVASNESFYENTHCIDGRPVFGPWPRHALPIKSHSESNHNRELTQLMEYDVKKSSSDTTIDFATTYYGKLSEVSMIGDQIARKYGIAKQESFENKLVRASSMLNVTKNSNTAMLKSDGIPDAVAKSEQSLQITPMLSPNEPNRFHCEQLQLHSLSVSPSVTPIVSMLETRIGTAGESSTDQDLEIDETDSTKLPTVSLELAVPQSMKSKGIDNELTTQKSLQLPQKHFIDLLRTASVSSVAVKTQKLVDATYQTALSQEDIQLKTTAVKQQRSNISLVKGKHANDFMDGIGKILRKGNGGIAALYKNTLEMPNSKFSKILYSMIA